MLKGCQREMIVLDTKESTLFESAWFVLRREKNAVHADDMLAEANRIVSVADTDKSKKHKKTERLLFFTVGAIIGAGIFALIWFLLH